MILNLLTETPIAEELEYLVEEKSKDKPATLYIRGPFIVAEQKNKNKRIYRTHDIEPDIERYVNELVNENRALNELEHPPEATVNSERASDLTVSLVKEGNQWIGKSRVLNTPMGNIVRSLIMDGVKLGKSSRALGKLTKLNESGGVDEVSNFKLIAVDTVADPSAPGAFVNGILESKQYVLNDTGKLEEVYDNFEDAIATLPRHEVDTYLREQIVKFITDIKSRL